MRTITIAATVDDVDAGAGPGDGGVAASPPLRCLDRTKERYPSSRLIQPNRRESVSGRRWDIAERCRLIANVSHSAIVAAVIIRAVAVEIDRDLSRKHVGPLALARLYLGTCVGTYLPASKVLPLLVTQVELCRVTNDTNSQMQVHTYESVCDQSIIRFRTYDEQIKRREPPISYLRRANKEAGTSYLSLRRANKEAGTSYLSHFDPRRNPT
jgi:hypothetical protein